MKRFKLMDYEYELDEYILDTKTNRKYDENNFELLVRILNNLHQEKISFCIEQLEKVKDLAHNRIKKIANDLSEEYDEQLNQKHTIHGLANAITDIDNQIKQLKEMM